MSKQCDQGFMEAASSQGDLYNQLVNDGEETNGSYVAVAALSCGALTAKIDIRHSRYVTENQGPGSYTKFGTLDGGMAVVPFFTAVESSTDFRFEYRVGGSAVRAGVGYVYTSTSYGYPHLRGVGAGFDILPDTRAGLRPYGSLFYYPAATGRYVITNPSSPNVGATLHVAFSIVKGDAGIAWNLNRSRLFFYAGYGDEVRTGKFLPVYTMLIRSSPYAGIGWHS